MPRVSSNFEGDELLDLILGNITEGVFTVDDSFRITFFNRAAEELTGFSRAEAVGRFCHEIFRTPICNQDCPLRRSVRTGRPVKNFEIDILTRKGDHQAISVSTAPLIDASGGFRGGVESFRDLTLLRSLQKEIRGRFVFQEVISKNRRMRQIFETLPNIAQSDATVLLHGRSGTGKELFARAIHNLSPRSNGPLIKVNCGALPETLFESELFGHVKGAFTDAKNHRAGRFRAAEGGTLFLDEVGDTPLPVQVKLLRVLQSREFEPLGSEETIQADVRLIAATNQDLDHLVAEGRFREDLYYRLNVIMIEIPDLCERTDDIPLLVEHFIERLNHRMGRNIKGLTEDAMRTLLHHPFPGNIRELENIIERAYIVCSGRLISVEDLPPAVVEGVSPPLAASPRPPQTRHPHQHDLREVERRQLIECLERNRWNIPRAARKLGMHRTTLWRKVKRLEICIPT